MNFLDLLNAVARVAKPAHQDLRPIDNVDTPFTDTDIDSLDGMMIVMYFSIIYGIPDEEVKEFHPKTPKELKEFVVFNHRSTPASIEEAMEMIK